MIIYESMRMSSIQIVALVYGHRNTGFTRSVKYGLISRLNLTLVVDLWICCDIRSHMVIPRGTPRDRTMKIPFILSFIFS